MLDWSRTPTALKRALICWLITWLLFFLVFPGHWKTTAVYALYIAGAVFLVSLRSGG